MIQRFFDVPNFLLINSIFSVMDKNDIHKKLFELECPFTWDLSENVTVLIDWNLDYDEKFVPELTFMRFIMAAYARALNLNYVEAEENVRKAETVIRELESSKIEVVSHILDSTKAHLLMKTSSLNEVEKTLENIKNIKDKIYTSVLNEMKCCVWLYYVIFSSNAISFVRLAVEQDPKSAITHFLFAKMLRSVRRHVSIYKRPDDEEIYHFTKAYELSRNPQFGLFLAQVFKESRKYDQAYKMYKEINEMNIKSASIQMRLALGFIQSSKLDLAKKCLDYVELVSPEDSMFLHYKGLYLMKSNNYEEASKYLLRASKSINYPAEITYVKCMRKLGKRFDFPAYFLNMVEKYSFYNELKRQEIILHVAFSYFWIKRDIKEAIKYFLRVFEIDPESEYLENYHDPLTDTIINVYQFLKADLLLKVQTYRQSKVIPLSDEIISASERLEKYCEKYESRFVFTKNELEKNFDELSVSVSTND